MFTDGGSQVSSPTDMMAKALLAPSLQKIAAILRFLARAGGIGIVAHAGSQKALFYHIALSVTASAPPIYFMLTNQMTGWINSISKIGNWNLDAGQAVPVRGNLGGLGLNYNMLQCKPAPVRHQLSCNG